MNLPTILLAEDDETDVLLLQRAFKEAVLECDLQVVGDGQQAIEFLREPRPSADDRLPALVMLDLKMPRLNGMEVLQWIRQQPALCTLPAFIFSSSGHHTDIEQAYYLGVNAYIIKPPSTAERTEVARFIRQWLRINRPPLVSTEGLRAAQDAHATGNFLRRSGC